MKIASLALTAFGPFVGETLELGDAPGLDVVYGPNEAGKSTTRRAIGGLLFGIPAQTEDAHVHAMKDLRIGARLVGEDGTVLDVVRRKGNKRTLVDAAGEPIDEAKIARLLGGATAELFRTTFGLDHVTLREGAAALLSGKGNLGESLFDAGIGGRGLSALLRELRAEADALYTPQARSRPVVEALRALADAQKRTREQSLSEDAFGRQRRAIEEAEVELSALDGEARTLSAALARLDRVRRAIPALLRRAKLVEERAELGDVPVLAPGATRERELDETIAAEAARQIAELSAAIDAETERRSRLSVPQDLLADEPAILEIQQRLGSHRKASEDLPRLRGDLAAREDEIARVASRLGAGSQGVRLEAASSARLRRMALERPLLAEKDAEVRASLAELEASALRARAAADELAAPVDDLGLRAAVERAQRDADVRASLGRLADEERRAEAAVQSKLRALGAGAAHADVAEIVRRDVPSVEVLDRLAAQLAQLDGRREEHARRVAANEASRRATRRAIDELSRVHAVPTEEDLARARAERDALWPAARDDGARTVDALRAATDQADTIADRLRREADRVARLAALLAARAAEDDEARSLAREGDELSAAGEALAARLSAAWSPVSGGAEPPPIAEMRAFRGRWDGLVAAWERLVEVRASRVAAAALVAERDEELARELAAIGRPLPDGAPAGSALMRAQVVLGELTERARLARERAERAEEQRVRLARARVDAEARAAASVARDAEWATRTGAAGFTGDPSSEEVLAVLDALADVAKAEEAAQTLRRRIAGIERDAARFAARVTELARAHLERVDEAPEILAELLIARWQAARADRERRDEIDRFLDERRAALSAQLARKHAAEARLLSRVRAAGVADAPALARAELAAARAREIEERIAQVDAQLDAIGDGRTRAELAEEASGQSADEVSARLDELRARLAEVGEARAATAESLAVKRHGLSRLHELHEPAEIAAGEAEEARVRVFETVSRYVRARLSVSVLSRELARYRESNQGPVVSRASQLFARLSGDAYAGLRAGFDDGDEPVLLAVRAAGEEVTVDGLSDGTRDQMYLALRLASLERYAEKADPLPLVLDDVLVHFDDERARAALTVLAEVGERMQVLFFTHHARLVELARESIPGERLRVHTLARRDPVPF